MGYLRDMYGTMPSNVVRGVLIGICFYNDYIECFGTAKNMKDALKEAVKDLAENPEDFDVQAIADKGYV